jgi:ParB family chromosome partitioning protein
MKRVDRSEATLLMGISNFMNRQKVLPSERGFTYAAMLKALKADKNRKNGTARDLLAKRLGEDARQISRFIRLTELIPDLLKLVDAGKLGLRPASELSYLSADTQTAIFQIYTETGTKPETMSIKQMREIEEERDLDADEIRRLLAEQDGSKKAEEYKMVFYSPVLCAILKNCHSISEREDRIIRGLKLLEEQDKERRAKREEEQRKRIEEIRKHNQEGGGDTYGG